MRLIYLLLTCCLPLTQTFAQPAVKGRVTDTHNQPIPGANVYLKGLYDGTSTAVDGTFAFTTTETGNQILVISFLGYTPSETAIQLPYTGSVLTIQLAESFNKLEAVTITAGAFEASDERKGVVLKPLDIAMTAGATADISGALNTLPGTQKVGETGRLFVRGGEGHEARTFIDGLWVQNPYSSTTGNLPGRTRFSPFMFKGTLFSTGGYSAEYSQALSSALILNTQDFPADSKTDISLLTVGAGLAHTQAGKKHGFSTDVSYYNLKPYFSLIKQTTEWNKAPKTINASGVYRYKVSQSGLLKIYGMYSRSVLGLSQTDAQTLTRLVPVKLDNQYGYGNASYRDAIGQKWSVFAGAAYNYSQDDIRLERQQSLKNEKSVHIKNTWTYDWTERVAVRLGGEGFSNRTEYTYSNTSGTLKQQVREEMAGAFTETDIYLSQKLTARAGLRLDYSSLNKQYALTPRLSMAYKTSDNSQISLAYGQFSQQAQTEWLRFHPKLSFEKASHYILNYQWMKNDRTLRAEVYHKQYAKLVQYEGTAPFNVHILNNGGNGYARGMDIFWRDKKSIKNADYWISYSFLDTRRQYLNYPKEATPTFASAHNFSAVYKHFVTKIRTQLGMTYSYTSPRPYTNPNQEGFNQSRTKAYQDLSFNAAFLYRQHIILYVSATNLLGMNNVFGYQYAQQTDENGLYRREAITQGAPRFLFMGLFITLSNNKKDNQLDNL